MVRSIALGDIGLDIPGGGQWTSDGEDPDDPPKRNGLTIGADMHSVRTWKMSDIRSSKKCGRSPARFTGCIETAAAISALCGNISQTGLKLDDLPHVIRSVFDPPKTLSELQTDKPPRGFDTETELRAYLGDPPVRKLLSLIEIRDRRVAD